VFACVNAPKPKLLGIVNVGPPYALEESCVTLPSPQKKLELLGLTEPSKIPVNEEVKLVVSKVPVPESITSSPSSNKRIVKVDDGATVGVGVGVGVGANGVAVGVDVGVGVGGIGVAVGVAVGVGVGVEDGVGVGGIGVAVGVAVGVGGIGVAVGVDVGVEDGVGVGVGVDVGLTVGVGVGVVGVKQFGHQ
jgi:hypothetical protein